MVLRLFVDSLSPPSRAVMLFVRAAQIPHVEVRIRISEGQQKTEEYKTINPMQKVPAIDKDGFTLSESNAILRYPHRQFDAQDFWYPKNSRSQALVDEYLEWQHLNTRIHLSHYFAMIYLKQIRGVTKYDENDMALMKLSVQQCLDDLQDVFLRRNSFIAGETISIADLVAAAELEEARIANCDVTDGRPVLQNYLHRVRQKLEPHYDPVHRALYKFQERHAAKYGPTKV